MNFVVHVHAQPFWMRDSFPYTIAYDEWKGSGDKRGATLYAPLRFCLKILSGQLFVEPVRRVDRWVDMMGLG